MRVMIALGMFAFVGCQEYNIDSQPEAAANIQDDALESYVMEAEAAASVVFNISANTPWRIERDATAQWCTVTPSMSATSSLVSEITVSVEDNDTFSPRSATLVITADAIAGYRKTITINQMSKGDFMITELGESVDAEGGVASFFIYTNKAWEFIPVTSYLTVDGVSSGEDVDDIATYQLDVNVPVNKGMEREAKFLIRTAAHDYECIITQTGIELRLADGFDTGSMTFDSFEGGSELSFDVKANISWTAEVDESCADWLEIKNITKSDKGGTITVATKGGINPYIAVRKGLINLTASDVAPVTVEVYQPSQFKRGGVEVVENEDLSATFNFGAAGARAFTAGIGGNKGTWVVEFDPDRAEVEEIHLYFVLSATGEFEGPCYRCAITSHAFTAATAPAGIYNNFMQHNNGGWTPNNRWNFDGVKVNGTPTQTDPDLMLPFEAVKRLEKVEFKFGEDGLYTTIYADGGVYSGELLFTDGKAEYDAMQFVLSMSTVSDAACGGHTTFAGESVTVTKAYFTPNN